MEVLLWQKNPTPRMMWVWSYEEKIIKIGEKSPIFY